MIESSYAKFNADVISSDCRIRLGEIREFREEMRHQEIQRVVKARISHNGKPPNLFERLFGFIYERQVIPTDPVAVEDDLDSWGGLNWVKRVCEQQESAVRRIIRLCEAAPDKEIYLCDSHFSAIYAPLE